MPEPGPASVTRSRLPVSRVVVLLCLLLTLWFAAWPFARACFRVEVDYNEGWNVYNTQRLVNHQQLYPVAAGWQSNNYPMGWFALLAGLHHVTQEYLFTARAVSLLALCALCVLAGAVVRTLGAPGRSALLAGLFCLGVFATDANIYVGMDDPQMLAQAVFLCGFLVYLGGRTRWLHVVLAALLFVVAGSIKHNPLDVPLAVLLDLLFVAWPLALLFAVTGLAFAAGAVALTLHFGGPFFLAQMLLPRTWTFSHLWRDQITGILGPLLIPLVMALAWAVWNLRHPRLRPVALLVFCALGIGAAFGGGAGVSLNTWFSAFVASSIALGVLFGSLEDAGEGAAWRPDWTERPVFGIRLRHFAVPLLFVWLLIPAAINDDLNPVAQLRQTREDARHFTREVDFLRGQPRPALCESLLRCWYAGEPYVYDPFNATRLIRFHRLDPEPMVDALRNGRIGAVQMDLQMDAITEQERWPASLLLAIREKYHPALVDDDAAIYVPNRTSPWQSQAGASTSSHVR